MATNKMKAIGIKKTQDSVENTNAKVDGNNILMAFFPVHTRSTRGVLLIMAILVMMFFFVKMCKNIWFSRCWGACCSRRSRPPEYMSISLADLETKIADMEGKRANANNTRDEAIININGQYARYQFTFIVNIL